VALVVESAAPAQRAEALRRLFPGPRADLIARRFEDLFRTGELDSGGLMVALENGAIVGVQFAYRIGGAQSALWPPAADDPAVQDVLVAAAMDWIRREPTKVVQSLIRPTERERAAALTRSGFRPITSLAFLSRECRPNDVRLVSARLRFVPFDAFDDTFVDLLMRTYEGTLDVSELNGTREPEEILAGYRAQGTFRGWWIFRSEERIGLLLLSERSDDPTVELSYVGLVPNARGLGLGREAIDFALAEAARSARHSIHLNVDVRNRPALRIYRERNFRTDEERELYLWLPG
jgi:ribosomal protein S18 acetylase RimI-like enzyme